ncbi:TonB-dependent receptor [Sphingosinicella sp. YJ22]|uniref:TonB-dependent receptor domain-containing protein n=1 Tax=Sphingosinicella sp. YJ22 TaxID=1104780 RepID=UPI00140CD7CD|nr:TonB-dependent receptor [Sphingosinicella sp. YJ22]
MRQTVTLRRSALCSASFIGMALALATPAYAQPGAETQPVCDPNDPTDVDCQPGQSEVEIESGTNVQAGQESTITVTGTRIRRPNVESNVPVTSVSAEELTSQGDVSVGDALNDLPSLRSTFSQANSTRFIGTTGLNLLDLRGLGTQRTLVLVNGRRHITSSVGDFLVDVNTIPSDLIERVDVVTGGSSAVYGSDAIAGVVNFVLRRDFEGIRLRSQAGISSEGDRGIYFTSLTAGENLFDDRLNVAVNLEYVHADALYFAQRDSLTGAASGRCQFEAAETIGGDGPTGTNGFPDTTFQCGVRNGNISTGGLLTAVGVTAATCRDPAILANPALAGRCINPGTPNGLPRVVVFDQNGNVVTNTAGRDQRIFGGANTIGGGLGSTLRETGQIAPGLDRYTANFLARFDLSPAFQPFMEAKYVYIESLQEGQPTFFQASFPQFFGFGRGFRCDNPFLTSANIADLQSIGRCLGGAASTETIPLSRFNIDFGGRRQFVERETFRAVAGIGGEFNGDWNYEVSFNYGRFEQTTSAQNDLAIFDIDADGNLVDQGPFLRATDSVRNASGQIVCRVNADADPTNDDPACVPLNPFGFGRPSQAALDYVTYTSTLEGSATQYNALAFVGGDLSQLFEFPGGPARFVLGGEYRREEAFQQADPLSRAGATFFNAFPTFDPPAFEVIEGFGELELPLLRDVPFAHELTVTGAARYSDYNTGADTTFAWNVNGTWAPVRDVRFRANFSRAVRVPTIGDLFTPPTQSFAFLADPCDAQNRNGGANPTQRQANCDAAGIPATFVNTLARSQTTEIAISGNPFLSEEKADSYTFGVVVTPSFVPGLSITADYYSIELKNRIETVGAQTVLNQCFDLPQPNEFCDLVTRRGVDDPTTPELEQFFFATPGVLSSGVNFARGEAEGVDFEVAYRRRFGNGVRLDTRAIVTYVIERNDFISPTNPDIATRNLDNLGDHQWAANFSATVGTGPFDLRYSVNFIGETYTAAPTNFEEFQGRPATNPDARAADELMYPDTFYHAIRFNIRPSERFQFYMGVDNLFDTQPPFGLLGGGGGDPYDPIGRYFYAGATVDF